MQFGKNEALFYLAYLIGNSDGEFSEDEMMEVLSKSEYYRNSATNLNGELLKKAVGSGALNESSALNYLKNLNINERIEILAACTLIAFQDEILTEEEKHKIAYFTIKLDVPIDSVIERYQQLK